MADEAASFSTDTLSMSEGFNKLISPPATPSIKIKGAVLLLIVPVPRMLMLGTAPGCPEEETILTPGNNPCSPVVTLVIGRFSIASALTIDTAPVTFTFFCTP